MSNVFVDVGVSLGSYIAGPNCGPQNPLGDNGPSIHSWMFKVQAWREGQSLRGGSANRDSEIADETFARAGAYIMGRRMFDEGEVSWPDPPPFRAPVYVLTNEHREPWVRQGGNHLHVYQ